jgi:hypothetical protein
MKGKRGVIIIENAEEKTDNKRTKNEWENKEEESRVFFSCLGSEKETSML